MDDIVNKTLYRQSRQL